jgi:FkbM family methyltransferase
VAGVYNTLGRVAAVNGQESSALAHFRLAVSGVSGDTKLVSQARAQREFADVKLSARSLTNRSTSNFQYDLLASKESMQDQGVTDSQNLEESIDTHEPDGITSYAQNFEDVMLWRALKHVKNGFYIDIGAQHPMIDSVSRAFYEHGWRGIHVEPEPKYAELLRQDRPDETVLEIAIDEQLGSIDFYDFHDTGLSTGIAMIAEHHKALGYEYSKLNVITRTLDVLFEEIPNNEVHWMKIDVEGMERRVLSGWNLSPKRPWVVVVESTYPNKQVETYQGWENQLLRLDYQMVYFDGLNRFYLSSKHKDLCQHFNCGPNVFDRFKMPVK